MAFCKFCIADPHSSDMACADVNTGFREVIEICDSDDEMCTGDRTASASKVS